MNLGKKKCNFTSSIEGVRCTTIRGFVCRVTGSCMVEAVRRAMREQNNGGATSKE